MCEHYSFSCQYRSESITTGREDIINTSEKAWGGARKNSGGKRPGAGRPKSSDPVKKFSVASKLSEYEAIKQKAENAGQSISRYLIDCALNKQ